MPGRSKAPSKVREIESDIVKAVKGKGARKRVVPTRYTDHHDGQLLEDDFGVHEHDLDYDVLRGGGDESDISSILTDNESLDGNDLARGINALDLDGGNDSDSDDSFIDDDMGGGGNNDSYGDESDDSDYDPIMDN